jgi:hypothetical protein
MAKVELKPLSTLRDQGRPGSLYEQVRSRKDITMEIGIIGAGSVAQAFKHGQDILYAGGELRRLAKRS